MEYGYVGVVARPRGTRVPRLVAASVWAVSVAALLLAPLGSRLDSEGLRIPALGTPLWWVGLVVVTAQAVALRWCTAFPARVLLVSACGVLIAGAAGLGDAVGVASLAVVAASSCWGSIRGSWTVAAAAAALVGVGTALSGAPWWIAAVQGGALVGLPALVAALVRGRRDLAGARLEQARSRAGELEARIAAAVSGERMAMARELHDIAAHHLSGIAMMASAIDRQLDTDPAAARLAIRQVRTESTAVLRDLRSLVGLLRDNPAGERDAHHEPSRPESLASITALVADVQRSGGDVELQVHEGHLPLSAGLGPLAQLAAYRTVQESMANAARHAPGARCVVTLDGRGETEVLVAVRNDRALFDPEPGTGGGLGLVGMRERAELTASALECGPTDTGGWQVTLRVPSRFEPEERT